ncbi:hypothetical protein, partial [Mogibacterium sp.]|uniref:hypothetical protein n=1 Tax=Mogibacterium sp. TaxID=2049035 RepID=UPI0025CEAAED
ERTPDKREVGGSSPLKPTTKTRSISLRVFFMRYYTETHFLVAGIEPKADESGRGRGAYCEFVLYIQTSLVFLFRIL